MKPGLALPIYWGILHAVCDWTAGYLIAAHALASSPAEGFTTLVIYGMIAFGGQLPLHYLLNRTGNLKVFGILAVFSMTLAIQLAFYTLLPAILVAAVASAGIHVAGSTTSRLMKEDPGLYSATFTVPGIAGFALGCLSGTLPEIFLFGVLTCIFICATLVFKEQFPAFRVNSRPAISPFEVGGTSLVLGLLVAVARVPVLGMEPVNGNFHNSSASYIVITILITVLLCLMVLIVNRINWLKFRAK